MSNSLTFRERIRPWRTMEEPVIQPFTRQTPHQTRTDVTELGSADSLAESEWPGSAPKLLLTPQEAAATLRMSRSSLYKFLLSGEIPSIKVGRMRRIPLIALREWVLKQTAA